MEKLNQKTIVQFIVNEIFNDTEALKNWVIDHGYQISNSSNGYDFAIQITPQKIQTLKLYLVIVIFKNFLLN